MTQVLVLGRRGQLARALAACDWPTGWAVTLAGRESLDLERLDGIGPFLEGHPAEVVINTAAYTAVDHAEAEPEAAYRLNAEAPERIAEACRRSGSLLVHLSTDYVFGGDGTAPFREGDPTSPVNVYGASKAEGERRVLRACPEATVARTAWLMSPESGFVAAILDRLVRKEAVKVVADQRGNTTRAADLAQALVRLVRARRAGTGGGGCLHMAGDGAASWFDVARDMAAVVGPEASVTPVPSSAHAALAQRPSDSSLNVTQLSSTYDICMASWDAWITTMAREGLIAAANRVEKGQQFDG